MQQSCRATSWGQNPSILASISCRNSFGWLPHIRLPAILYTDLTLKLKRKPSYSHSVACHLFPLHYVQLQGCSLCKLSYYIKRLSQHLLSLKSKIQRLSSSILRSSRISVLHHQRSYPSPVVSNAMQKAPNRKAQSMSNTSKCQNLLRECKVSTTDHHLRFLIVKLKPEWRIATEPQMKIIIHVETRGTNKTYRNRLGEIMFKTINHPKQLHFLLFPENM